ncbi:MAG: alpha/beta fold hydrolase [Chloroflexota bacterium]|nr:alpha/beta fold hydrolase [Chloroflexota bacterium]
MTAPDDAPAQPLVPLPVDEAAAPPPDPSAEPAGYLVTVDDAVRLHFLDWGAPLGPQATEAAGALERPTVVLIHGIAQTGVIWAPVARRLRGSCAVVAMDLRGHGLSDSPTHGYEPASLAGDVEAVIDASAGSGRPPERVVLVGHGFGAMVAAWAAAGLGDRCVGLVLVDGGWEDIAASNALDPAEFLHAIEEPPEVLRSMGAYLADRRSFDAQTWDADQEAAARAAVVEVPAGKVVLGVRPHALAASVEAMFSYRPVPALSAVRAPIVALIAADDDGSRSAALDDVAHALSQAGRPPIRRVDLRASGHNLMRYRPAAVTAAILAID